MLDVIVPSSSTGSGQVCYKETELSVVDNPRFFTSVLGFRQWRPSRSGIFLQFFIPRWLELNLKTKKQTKTDKTPAKKGLLRKLLLLAVSCFIFCECFVLIFGTSSDRLQVAQPVCMTFYFFFSSSVSFCRLLPAQNKQNKTKIRPTNHLSRLKWP